MEETRNDPGAQQATQEDRRERRMSLLAWIILVALSICLIFACAQLAFWGVPDGSQVSIASMLEADYAPWGAVKFGPLSSAILLDIIEELRLAGLAGPVLSDECLVEGACDESPAPPSPTASPSATASLTPTASGTPTPTGSATVTPTRTSTATHTLTPSNTPTPTPLVYPVKLANPSNLDPEASETVAFTIYVINYGSVPPANLTAVCDFLPVGMDYGSVAADRGGSVGACPDGSGTGIVWNVGVSIPQGSYERFTFTVDTIPGLINAGDTLTNTVRTIGGNFNTAVNWRTLRAYTPTPQAFATPDSYTTDEDTPLSEPAPGVLGNDINGDTASVIATPPNGALSLLSDGSFTYSPNLDWNGVDTFYYEACATGGTCSTTTVTLNVASVEDAPTVVDDTYSMDEDGFLSVPASTGVLANDWDGDPADILRAYQLSSPPASEGTVSGFSSDGSFNFTPTLNWFGTASFNYQACDEALPGPSQDCSPGSVSITVNEVNDPPTAADDSASVDEDSSVNIDVLGNDADGDPAPDPLTVQSVVQPTNGTVSNNGSDVTYTPDPNYRGPDSFTYVVSDGRGGTDTATVTITVNPINDSPTPAPDSYSTDEDSPLTVSAPGVLVNDAGTGDTPLTLNIVVTPPAAEGSVALSDAGSFSFMPAANFNGTTSFQYTITDSPQPPEIQETSDPAIVTITVISVNDAPVAGNDGPYALNEDTILDTAISGDPSLLANDSDVDVGQTLTVTTSTVSGPSNGNLTLRADGTFVYSPNADFRGSDSFVYEACDDGSPQLCDTAMVDLTVVGVNDIPVAADDSASTDEDTSVTIGVLANDGGLGDTPLSVTIESGPSDGSVVVNADNTILYTPDLNFNGFDSFIYRVTDTPQSGDEVQEFDTAQVDVTVNAVNDPPVASDDGPYNLDEDTSLDTAASGDPNLMDNDSDIDTGDTLSVTTSPVSGPSNGSLTLRADGTFEYTPNPDYRGSDSFVYEVCDSGSPPLCDTATVDLTVDPVNDTPQANPDGDSTNEDTAVTINVLANDSGLGDTPLMVTITSGPINGSAIVLANNQIRYTPDADWFGLDILQYTVTDSGALAGENSDTSLPASVTITVVSVNDPPQAVDDAASVDEDESVTITVLANDSDIDGFIVSSTVAVTSGPSNGATSVNLDGSILYTPDPDFRGSDSFTYTVDDDQGGTSNAATVTVTVNSVNDTPSASPDSYSTDEDTTLNVSAPGVLANDSGLGDTPLDLSVVSGPSDGGSLTLNDNGSFSYTPSLNFNGPATFTYEVQDDDGETSQAQVTITVNAVNDPPVAGNDSDTTSEDTPVTIDVLANDTDPVEGDSLTVGGVTNGSNGTVTNNGTDVTYTPDADWFGTDMFTYDVCDSGTPSQCDTGSVTVTVSPVNDTPSAAPDSYVTDEDTPLNQGAPGVLANDSGVGDTPLDLTVVSGPSDGGSLTLNDDGSFSYTPASDFNGIATFDYQVCDSDSPAPECSQATVTITVNSVNDPPVAGDDGPYTLDEDTGLDTATSGDSNLMINDSDVDGDTLTVTALPISGPTNGSLTLRSDGTFLYAPDANFEGSDSFVYQVCDNGIPQLCDSAAVSITVNPVNDPPQAVDDDAGTIDQGTPVTINVASNDTDPDAGDAVDPTSVTISAPPSAGTAVSNGDGTVTYTHDGGPDLGDSFSYEICDQGTPTLCDTATVSVSIRPPDLFVDISPESHSASPGSTVSFTVAFGNSGPGTAYDVQVTATASGGCSVLTSNPLFAGHLDDGSGGFVTIDVQAPSGAGASCDVMATVQSTNGMGESDTSTITTPVAALQGSIRAMLSLRPAQAGGLFSALHLPQNLSAWLEALLRNLYV